jgi:hypothetical protein
MDIRKYLPDELQYVADALRETIPYWESIDTGSADQASSLPHDVLVLLAETYVRMFDTSAFSTLKRARDQLSASGIADEVDAARVIDRMNDLFTTLCNSRVAEFAERLPTDAEIVERTMAGGDWTAVSPELVYLRGAAERFWRYASPKFYDGPPRQHLSNEDMRVLTSVAKTIYREGHDHRIQECQTADGFQNRAYDKMQMLSQLLDEVGLSQ